MKSVYRILKITTSIAIAASLESALGMLYEQGKWGGLRRESISVRCGLGYFDDFQSQVVRDELGDFYYRESQAFEAIMSYFGALSMNQLLSVLELIAYTMEAPELTRREKRSFPLMVKYVQDNYDNIVPLFKEIELIRR
ncbi:MAG: hypothetical protein LBE95_02600 [Holosporaceae bacterium]|jgi:hypothetical protein|nr:hypothetical protein [Holosporaceae bacterium]